MTIRCGILANAYDYLIPYVQWAVDEEKKNTFSLSGIYTNNIDHYKPITNNFVNSIEELVETSDIIFSFGYWKILSIKIINKVPLGIINVHHSYKLKYRGRHAATWAIRNKEKIHGSTIHYINENLDDGPIIDTDFCKIEDDDTAYTLFMKVNEIGLKLFKRNINNIVNNTVKINILADPNYLSYKEKDLSFELDKSCLDNVNYLYNEVRELTFPNKPKPYIQVQNKKLFLELK